MTDPLLRRSGQGSQPDGQRLAGLLDRAMMGLSASEEPAQVWSKLFSPGERVGIKVNALGGRGLSTHVALVEAVCRRLQDAGVRARDIVVWDRDTAELERAGFHIAVGGDRVQCYGTDRVGYEAQLESFGEVGSLLSTILTRFCDSLINMPVLKDHDGAGVTLALKNMFGVIHNPNKLHPNGCDPYVADVNMLVPIRSKLRLCICDALTAQYHGGPAFKPEFTWHANTLMTSFDPVALDTIGWQMIERKRAEKGLKTLVLEGRPPVYIATAADGQHRLGTNDRKKIALIESQMT